jgi:hypothetical protein
MALQDFFRMRNIFGGSPNQSVNSGASTPPFLPSRNTVPPSTYQESIDVFPEEETALSALKRNVMNPPEVPFEYPKSAAAGITEALKIAAEPSPLEKNRVYVDGKAYQKQQVITDAEGKKHYVTNVHEPSFMQQVMRAMPAAASAAPDILNAQAQRPIAEWEMRNKALTGAANIEKTEETNRALAAQRYANAGVIPQREARLTDQGQQRLEQGNVRLDQGQQKIDVSKYNAETKRQLAQLHDLPDSEKLRLLQEGKITMQNLKDASDLREIEARGGEARKTEGVKQEGRKEIQEMRGEQATEQIGARGEESRKTKETAPGGAGATAQLPTQQKVAQQMRATQATREHPEWKKYISTDPNTGMVEIMPPATGYFSRGPDKETYDAMVAYMGGSAPSAGAPTKPTTTTPTKPAATTAKPPPAKGSSVPKGYVKVADSTSKVIATIPEGDVARLNKSKYHVVQ